MHPEGQTIKQAAHRNDTAASKCKWYITQVGTTQRTHIATTLNCINRQVPFHTQPKTRVHATPLLALTALKPVLKVDASCVCVDDGNNHNLMLLTSSTSPSFRQQKQGRSSRVNKARLSEGSNLIQKTRQTQSTDCQYTTTAS